METETERPLGGDGQELDSIDERRVHMRLITLCGTEFTNFMIPYMLPFIHDWIFTTSSKEFSSAKLSLSSTYPLK